MLSYHNDAKLKKSIVIEMQKHHKQDQIIKGTYGHMNGKFKGCAVGCAIDSMNRRLKKDYDTDNHRVYEEAIGVPEWLARLHDCIFEGLPDGDNTQFAVDLLKAIPVGVNLEPVKWKFCAYLLRENIDRVLALDIKDDLKKQVVDAIRQCLFLQETAINTGVWDESAARSAESAAWSAESAARSVAWSAASAARSAAASAAASAAWSAAASAASAARSAAASAAWSAASAAWSAESAARSAAASAAASAASAARSAAASAAASAAYQRHAKELLKLLSESK